MNATIPMCDDPREALHEWTRAAKAFLDEEADVEAQLDQSNRYDLGGEFYE